jgi:hypothetical protein
MTATHVLVDMHNNNHLLEKKEDGWRTRQLGVRTSQNEYDWHVAVCFTKEQEKAIHYYSIEKVLKESHCEGYTLLKVSHNYEHIDYIHRVVALLQYAETLGIGTAPLGGYLYMCAIVGPILHEHIDSQVDKLATTMTIRPLVVTTPKGHWQLLRSQENKWIMTYEGKSYRVVCVGTIVNSGGKERIMPLVESLDSLFGGGKIGAKEIFYQDATIATPVVNVGVIEYTADLKKVLHSTGPVEAVQHT